MNTKAMERTLTQIERLAYDSNYEQAIRQLVMVVEELYKEVRILKEDKHN